MARKKVSFIATKHKNKKVNVGFYTKEGKRVSFEAVQKVPKREKIEFFVPEVARLILLMGPEKKIFFHLNIFHSSIQKTHKKIFGLPSADDNKISASRCAEGIFTASNFLIVE